MLHRLPQFVIPILFLAAHSPSAEACRYSVRDVGFVEIHPEPYRLQIVSDSAESAPRHQDLVSVSRLALVDSNFVVEEPSLPSHPEIESNRENRTAALVLDSPDPEIASLRIPFGTSTEALTKTLEAVVTSKVRDRYLARMLDIYGAILFVESENESSNLEAKAAIEAAVAKIKEYMTLIPKPVNEPPEVISIPNDGSEKVLLWSLGIEDRTVPHVAVLFGRGRRIGEVLTGAAIAVDSLYEILSVIGLDCECGLDRSWMQGICVPLRWDQKTQEQTARALDFDPENPIVKMEISQILSQGGLGTRRAEGAASDPFLGYSERSVSFKKLDFESEERGRAIESATSAPRTATALSNSESLSSPIGLSPLRVPPAVEPAAGRFRVWGVGSLAVLGLSIFAVGFYILLRARRLEP